LYVAKTDLRQENTRLRKTSEGHFEILIASAVTEVPADGGDIGKTTDFTINDSDIPTLHNAKIKLVYGDHSEQMRKIVAYQKQAGANAANEVQKSMHEAYTKAFETGSMNAFKDSQRFWIRDTKPMIECNIGFIESYRDPKGVRGEWEGQQFDIRSLSISLQNLGFAAIVNLERSRAFSQLVEMAESKISNLPWSKEFEKDEFLSPDFTSLEVMNFGSASMPLGINIVSKLNCIELKISC